MNPENSKYFEPILYIVGILLIINLFMEVSSLKLIFIISLIFIVFYSIFFVIKKENKALQNEDLF